jgi:hypothetical protein
MGIAGIAVIVDIAVIWRAEASSELNATSIPPSAFSRADVNAERRTLAECRMLNAEHMKVEVT